MPRRSLGWKGDRKSEIRRTFATALSCRRSAREDYAPKNFNPALARLRLSALPPTRTSPFPLPPNTTHINNGIR